MAEQLKSRHATMTDVLPTLLKKGVARPRSAVGVQHAAQAPPHFCFSGSIRICYVQAYANDG